MNTTEFRARVQEERGRCDTVLEVCTVTLADTRC